MVPVVRLELTRSHLHWILNPARLPIPPHRPREDPYFTDKRAACKVVGLFLGPAATFSPLGASIRVDMAVFRQELVEPAMLLRAQAGDMEAHSGLYTTYSRGVYTLARRMLMSTSLAEDVLQETFVEVIRKIHTYRGEAELGHWIRRIATNKCLMLMRSSWESKRSAEPEAHEPRAERDPADERMDLEQALAALSPTSRAVVWLHDVEGYTHQEIGQLMGRTTSFSKSQLARAHDRLKVLLDGEHEQQETEQCDQVLKTC